MFLSPWNRRRSKKIPGAGNGAAWKKKVWSLSQSYLDKKSEAAKKLASSSALKITIIISAKIIINYRD